MATLPSDLLRKFKFILTRLRIVHTQITHDQLMNKNDPLICNTLKKYYDKYLQRKLLSFYFKIKYLINFFQYFGFLFLIFF